MSKILGVDEMTICNWEKNRCEPSLNIIPKIVEFLGYIPFDTQTITLGEKILAYRKSKGQSQEQFAQELGVDPGTLARWEQDKSHPKREHLDKLVNALSHLF